MLGELTLLIKTIYSPKLTESHADFASSSSSSSNERTYILFYEDEIGYKITYSLSPDIAYKYQDDVFSIVSRIREIIAFIYTIVLLYFYFNKKII